MSLHTSFFATVLALALVPALNAEAAKAKSPAQRASGKSVPRPRISIQAKKLIFAKDFLGFRVFVRKAYPQKMSHSEWFEIKNLISQNCDRVGYDLISFWNARNSSGKSEIDLQLEKADTLMLAGRFEEAFTEAQAVAKKLKVMIRSRPDARIILPYVFHTMGRALYGARRFDESMEVYQWINTAYPHIRQVLFEKMWAAFKAGRVDIALGAIASQRSGYFSTYLPTESYLIQTYLFKRLCRDDDLNQVNAEMKNYEEKLSKGTIKDWVNKDITTSLLYQLSQSKPKPTDLIGIVSLADRLNEQKEITDALNRVYEKQKPVILSDLKTILAYAHLAKVSDTSAVLKPVQSLKSRDDLLKMDLEVWPADSSEEWLDEIGKHVLIGESLCNKEK
ncbi:MAG: hypothetical protein KGP28_07675 [Bdellovibrionales bacterium]|nr:hypothetical protein [Bdellovibrionales bacterium]